MKQNNKVFKNFKLKNILKAAPSVLTLSPALALADSNGFELQSILQALIKFLNGGIARVIFIIAIVGIGYGWLYMGRIPKERAVGAIIGIGIVFSAGYIAQQLGIGG